MPSKKATPAAAVLPAAKELDHIVVRGAREHNLKHVDVDIPKKQLVVFTGVSGSGKSSLAFDTLYAEGQRRYVESLSAYARQFLGQMDKPHYDTIRGLSPTISIEQKTASNNPRSTVGTITEIYDYLRVLYARAGTQHCYSCGRPVAPQSAQQIVDELLNLPERTKYLVLAPLVENRKGEHRELIDEVRQQGFTRLRVNGEMRSLDDDIALEKKKKHTLEVVVDRLISKPDARARVTDSVETALKRGEGRLIVSIVGEDDDRLFSEHLWCSYCSIGFPELSPQSFSFNSPLGMCPDCNGLGTRLEVDPARIVPDDSLAISEGAIRPYKSILNQPSGSWTRQLLRAVGEAYDFDLDTPWKALTKKQQKIILYGTGDDEVTVRWKRGRSEGSFSTAWEGAVNNVMRLWKETDSEDARARYARYLSDAPCRTCNGSRLRRESSSVLLGERSLVEVNGMTIAEAHGFFADIELTGAKAVIAEELKKEIVGRLSFLLNVGLEYLNLNRPGPTLSGGESQRIRLASQMGSELTGVLYILDEPSIGLHPRDTGRLIGTLEHLRDLGNSVIVVEHDSETIARADWLVDFGPAAGVHGGKVVAAGPPGMVARDAGSLTAEYISGRREIEVPEKRRTPDPDRMLGIRGARANNLKTVDVDLPVGLFVCVTGVSGAGKSTLINDILYPSTAVALNGARMRAKAHDSIVGMEHFDKVIDIDQTPIGRTPRSNPATYTKVWDEIRKVYAGTKEAKAYGFTPGRFSFNVKGGRCESCQGAGVVKVEMHFLADVYVPCEVCSGRRFNDATLRVRYRDKDIHEMLETSIDEAAELFQHHRKVGRILRTLQDVGLGYLKLGQPSTTLSGGEAQRIKLSRELARTATGRTLYILDEPSTGLHFEDVRKLLGVTDRLVEAGNTVVMIEHNLDIIKTADWIVDLGPEGGDGGGRIVASGPPEAVAGVAESYTGQALTPLLGRSRGTGRKARAAAGG